MKIELSPFGIVERIRNGLLKTFPDDVSEEEVVRQAAAEIKTLFMKRVHAAAEQLMTEIPDRELAEHFPDMESLLYGFVSFVGKRLDKGTLP